VDSEEDSEMLKRALIGMVLLVVATSSTTIAQTIDSDGGTHTVSGPGGPIEVLDDTTLNIVAPASITSL
jgi:hypothetical protein